MSIPMPPIELLKEGRVIGHLSCTASYGNTKKVEDCIRWLKGWHDIYQNYDTPKQTPAMKASGKTFPPKDYDAMRVKWFGENIITWYLTGQALLDGEVINDT